MLKSFVPGVAVVLVASIGLSASLSGQGPPARPAGAEQDQVQARYNIFVMEGVLERAVEHGADRLRRQVRRVMPDMLLLSGGAEARGFRLDGYGVFFDVEVPVMRRSVAWSLRTMIDDNGVTALQQLKAAIERLTPDAREKAALMQAIKRLEVQVGPPAMPSIAGGPAMAAAERGTVTAMEAAPSQVASPGQADTGLLEDPNGAYEREVITALIDAMLDHSGPIRVAPDEWLTVAARDNEHRDRLVPGDPYDLLTIVLRIKGSDLAAFRADRITRDEARQRVEVSEF
ncbi:MAG: hypothetical protein ACRD26_00705 [Vicinamibacterales bacterium]